MTRDPDLQALLDALGPDSARAAPAAGAEGHRVVAAVLARCRLSVGQPGPAGAARLPACSHLAVALSAAAAGRFAATTQALARLSPRLAWTRRATARPEDQPFYDGHANALLCGPGGLEDRGDVMLGLSLVAPGVTYPDHDHPPEECYLPLGPGQWWNSAMGWVDPQGRALVYNPPGIRHAMRASPDAPLLALWFLLP